MFFLTVTTTNSQSNKSGVSPPPLSSSTSSSLLSGCKITVINLIVALVIIYTSNCLHLTKRVWYLFCTIFYKLYIWTCNRMNISACVKKKYFNFVNCKLLWMNGIIDSIATWVCRENGLFYTRFFDSICTYAVDYYFI